jgi:hypothetical protein
MATAQDRGTRVVHSEAFAGEPDGSPAPRGTGKADFHLSPEEVEKWLELFEEDGS